MTGLAQKNGAVFSHACAWPSSRRDIAAQRIAPGAGRRAARLRRGGGAGRGGRRHTRARPHAGGGQHPTWRRPSPSSSTGTSRWTTACCSGGWGRRPTATPWWRVDGNALTTRLLGDSLTTTSFLLGVAVQSGLLPVAPRLAGGRDPAERRGRPRQPDRLPPGPAAGRPAGRHRPAGGPSGAVGGGPARDAGGDRRASLRPPDPLPGRRPRGPLPHLGGAGRRRRARDARPASRSWPWRRRSTTPSSLAYKDEYEVARMLSDPALHEEIGRTFAEVAPSSPSTWAPPVLGGPAGSTDARRSGNSPPAERPMLALLARGKRVCAGLGPTPSAAPGTAAWSAPWPASTRRWSPARWSA